VRNPGVVVVDGCVLSAVAKTSDRYGANTIALEHGGAS